MPFRETQMTFYVNVFKKQERFATFINFMFDNFQF